MQPTELACSECGESFQIVGDIGTPSDLDARPCPECGAIIGDYTGTAEELRQEYARYETAHRQCEAIVTQLRHILEKQDKFEGTGGTVYPSNHTSIERLQHLRTRLETIASPEN